MTAIPDRVWELLTATEKEHLESVIDGWRQTPVFLCPHCQQHVTVRMKVKVTVGAAVSTPTDEIPRHTPAPHPGMNETDRRVLNAAHECGVFDAFARAVISEKEFSGVPSDLDAFFLLFWSLAAPVKVPAVVLASLIQEWGGYIEVYGSNGIFAVLSDGDLVTFVPERLTKPTPVAGPGMRPRIPNTAGFESWTKGQYGYVPTGARSFGAALRQKNVGKFGAIVQ